ncbi:MAG: GTP-dependent dephospho-CoA kinase family protein [Halobacteriales archaeon]|nr:GTP-dependent dephospho-CoA kinase family protein [Halobacteriales archaeon]
MPENLRADLAKPLGPVLQPPDAAAQAKRAKALATVGDVTTEAMLGEGLMPRVMVVDNRTKRGAVRVHVRERVPEGTPVVQVRNEAATISEDLWQAVATAWSSKQSTLIEVDGEEDLATLPAVLLGPTHGLVAYGQPDQGIVLLTIDDAARGRVRDLLKHMEGS